ncbi:MAG: hypothetical protein J6N95_05460 [Bacilli bacterium]|nr:hypothetical protein [Bacilli bacterium]MBO6280629.1 hypothetical protein [Bacilli bacterium]
MNFNKKIIKEWNEAIPLGNGYLGGLLFGNENQITLNLDCSLLWDLRTNVAINEGSFTFKKMLSLIESGEEYNAELQERFGNFYEKDPFPTKIPSGKIVFSCNQNIRENFYLDLNRAIGGVKLIDNKQIDCFFSAINFLGYIRFPKEIDFDFVPPSFNNKVDKDGLSLLGYEKGEIINKDNLIIYRQPISDGFYSVVIKSIVCGDCKIAVFSIIPSYSSKKEKEVIIKIEEALKQGFDSEFIRHKKWWKDYFNITSIELPKTYQNIQDQYYFMQYLFGSGSRKGYPPMPLQGVWTAANDKLPPWKGDYHFDLNVQGTYNWAFRSGKYNEIYPLIEYFIKNYETISLASNNFFEQEDVFLIPGAADLNGRVMGGWVQYTYSIASSIWMVIILNKWYEHTFDQHFLNNYLLPIFKKTFVTLKNNFLKKKNDKYELVISISPEINNNYYSAWLKNSTYDISLIRDFLIRYIDRLEENREDAEEIKNVLTNLALESRGEEGYLLSESFSLNQSHRHLSHCMNIFPLQYLDSLNKSDYHLMKQTINNIEKYGTSEWVGFTFTWMASLFACSNNGEEAIKYLNYFLDAFVSDNGFHLNGDYKKKGYSNFDYRPFTLEANGMFNDAVQEMLMQYHHDILRLFPAIPKKWKEEGCSFKGFYINKNIYVSSKIKDKNVECEINSSKEFEITISLYNKIYKRNIMVGKNIFTFKI